MSKPTKRFLTIKREMFLLSVLSFWLVSLLISGVLLAILYDNNLKSARALLRECNSQIVTFTEGLFRENAAIVELLSTENALVYASIGDKEALLARFDTVLKNNRNLTYVYAGYADGSLYIRGYDTPSGYDATTRPWYKAAIAAQGVARLVYRDAANGTWLFSQCTKLVDENGVVLGVLGTDCSNESINRQLSSKYRYSSQRSFIIDSDSTVLTHPSEEQINRKLLTYMDEQTWNAVMSGSTNYAEYYLDGVKAMAYLERIPDTSFTVVTAVNASEVMQPISHSIVVLLGIIATLSLVLGVAMSRIYILRFAQPLRALSGRIQKLAAGNTELGYTLGSSNAEMRSIAQNIEIIVKDMASREEAYKAAEYRSMHDSMTGLYNRRFFEGALARLDTADNYPLCLLCCDVNGLKLVNDVLGHAVGDRLLNTAAACLQQAMREDDVLARMGGDEFSAVLPRTGDLEIEQIIRRVQSALPKDGMLGAEVSVSMGFAFKSRPEQQVSEVARRADEMMYAKKTKESAQMKQRTVDNIIAAAESEGLVRPANEKELQVLKFFSFFMCPESEALLLDSYRLRKLGRCSLLSSIGFSPSALERRHTETGYRILSSLDCYRGVAACVLHFNERWDGSGWPSGLSGLDIPLLSRIIAVTQAYVEHGFAYVAEKGGTWYEQELVDLLKKLES